MSEDQLLDVARKVQILLDTGGRIPEFYVYARDNVSPEMLQTPRDRDLVAQKISAKFSYRPEDIKKEMPNGDLSFYDYRNLDLWSENVVASDELSRREKNSVKGINNPHIRHSSKRHYDIDLETRAREFEGFANGYDMSDYSSNKFYGNVKADKNLVTFI